MRLPDPTTNNELDARGKLRESVAQIIRPAFFLSQNLISRVGVVLTTTAGITLVIAFASLLVGYQPDPYAGILVFMILPTVFALGLILIPIGIWRDYRRRRRTDEIPSVYPKIDLSYAGVRSTLFLSP